MTGLDLVNDALIEVAALVTDFDLNVLGDGIDIVVKPPAEALDQMIPFVRTMHEQLRAARRARRRRHPGGGRGAGARLHPRALRRRQPPAAGRQHGRHRPVLHRPRHARPWTRSCTTGSSTSPRSRSCPGGGTPRPTSARRPSAATTGPWPTSRRASRSCATTATPCSCRHPARTRDVARAIARPARRLADRPPGARPRFRDSARFRLDSLPVPGTHRDRMVGIAQLVERRVVVADVAGSSPVTHPSTPATAARARPIASGSPPAVACTSAPS